MSFLPQKSRGHNMFESEERKYRRKQPTRLPSDRSITRGLSFSHNARRFLSLSRAKQRCSGETKVVPSIFIKSFVAI